MLEKNHISEIIVRELNLQCKELDMRDWEKMLERIQNRNRTVHIALVGKYVRLHDAYLSVAEALNHGGYENGVYVKISWIDSEEITRENVAEKLKGMDGILVPGGFGYRGVEGMIETCRYARENNIPYLGICLGMQISVIEFARNVLGYEDANSSEFVQNEHNVIDLMIDQKGQKNLGGTLRLGAYPCVCQEGSRLKEIYGQSLIQERHRHRYEFNNAYRRECQKNGLQLGGLSPDGSLVEAIEIPANRFHVAVQYHPEFKSRPNRAHPLFREFIQSCLE